jgi:large subunit ribosomal protein L25
MVMELTVVSRDAKKKSDAKKVRREGGIPAILYSRGEAGKEIVVSNAEFQKLLQSIPKQTLSSKVIVLKEGNKTLKVIVKGIQYHPVTYNILHLDFQELHEGEVVNIKIPLLCTGVADCAGIKLGGVLRQIVYSVLVRVEPKDIPSHFELDIRELVTGQVKKLSDISYPKGVSPLADMNETALIIGKR